MTGSSRVFDHTTFLELLWQRNSLTTALIILPPGYRNASRLLGPELVEILKDVHALQCIREGKFFEKADAVMLRNVDNHQASTQSRLLNLPPLSPIASCCLLGAYICSTMLRGKLWHASIVPVSRPKDVPLCSSSLTVEP
jgi:hypothetical protein